MKRFLSLLICLMLPLCAFAEGLPEIDFDGLQLGLTLAEVKIALKDTPEYDDLIGIHPAQSHDICTLERLTTEIFSDEGNPVKEERNSDVFLIILGDTMEVAGYKAYPSWRFVRPVVDGAISADDEQAVFYAGSYSFESNFFWGDLNCRDVHDELKGILNSLYGEGVASTTTATEPYSTTKHGTGDDATYTYKFDTYEFTLWQGADDKQVLMSFCERTKLLRITYLWMGAQQMISDALALCPPPEESEKDISGL